MKSDTRTLVMGDFARGAAWQRTLEGVGRVLGFLKKQSKVGWLSLKLKFQPISLSVSLMGS
jgi:hypothetical protein